MRNAHPLVLDQLIHHRAAAVILLGQRLALGGHVVADALKLGKHGLPIHRGVEFFQQVHQQIFLRLGIGELLLQTAQHQRLIAGGSHLRHKQAVARLGIGLMRVAHIGVHGMTQLMRQRHGTVQIVGLVQQHIRVNPAKIAAGKSAA